MLLTIPVEPDAETARQWAVDELSRSTYREKGPSWLERFWDWLSNLLGNAFDFDLGAGGVLKAVIVLTIIAALIFLVLRLTLGPVRRAVGARRAHFVFEDDHRDSRAMRVAADAAAAAGDWTLAVLERFRAIVRSLEERDLLEDRPAVTADEAAWATGLRFPDLLRAMAEAAETFDGVRYGHATVGPANDAALRELDAILARRSILDTATL